ncbi:MAG: transposase [Candidatus Omnitrophica bacterium]|nr:transposase [Candidatus Omnitrophota bacterium]
MAKQRHKILKFYEQYGEEATRKAFGASRKVVYHWRKLLKDSGGRLEALVPSSTRPDHARCPEVPKPVVDFIKRLRQEHPRLGKQKIKPLLDRFCKAQGLRPIAESTIGKIVKREGLLRPKPGRIYHDPSSPWARGTVRRKPRLRVRRAPRPEEFGHIVSDTVEHVTEGIKTYFINAIDARMRFALSIPYKQLSSRNMVDFLERFRQVYPGAIRVWQSDNGPENLGRFEDALDGAGIPHYFSYPRCPKINGHIERYNRSFQEEFLYAHQDLLLTDLPLFGKRLVDWLIFYNAERPHQALGLKSPLEFMVFEKQLSKMCVASTSAVIPK